MTSRLPRLPLELILLPLLLAAAWTVDATNHWLEARQVSKSADGDIRVLPDGNVVRVLSLGFERTVADLFWIRTAAYIGDSAAADAKWPAAERLANLVTDVDPYFDTPYVVMASVLNGMKHDPDAAIRVLEKGTKTTKYWRIHFLLAFQYFMEKQDYVRGAQCLERAIALGGGPPYLQFLVSRLYSNAGDPTTAMQFIAARLKNEEDPNMRAQLEERLSDIWVNRDLGLIDAAIASYGSKHKGAVPKNIRALVDAGLLPALPRDPKGGEYSIEDGRAHPNIPYTRLNLNNPRPPE
jgi:hypothetical protein